MGIGGLLLFFILGTNDKSRSIMGSATSQVKSFGLIVPGRGVVVLLLGVQVLYCLLYLCTMPVLNLR